MDLGILRNRSFITSIADELTFFLKKLNSLTSCYNNKKELEQLLLKHHSFLSGLKRCSRDYIGLEYQNSEFSTLRRPHEILRFVRRTFLDYPLEMPLDISETELKKLQELYRSQPSEGIFHKIGNLIYGEDEKYKFYRPVFFLQSRLQRMFYDHKNTKFKRAVCGVRYVNKRSRLVRPCFSRDITAKEDLYDELDHGSRKEWLVTLDVRGKFIMSEATRGCDEVNHCDLPGGKDVICAGEIVVVSYSRRLKITNMSGSYTPGSEGAISNMVLVLVALGVTQYAVEKGLKIEIIFHYDDNYGNYSSKDVTALFTPLLQLTPELALRFYHWGVYDNVKFYSPRRTHSSSMWKKYGSMVPRLERTVRPVDRMENRFLQWLPAHYFFPPGFYDEVAHKSMS
ncbi:hypothetical protein P0136_00300 [Lentisphaerota bacterium ZTH]|nr:hypothetical protein JYG24_08555 [Lentisphaerota bacterium]WET06457.1 hypothetical protein P0136_00300 [Lentisphaerota bacterium ZTH]